MSTEIHSTKKKRMTFSGPQTIVVQKTPPGAFNSSYRASFGAPGLITQTRVRQSYASSPVVSGVVADASKKNVQNVVVTRDKERQEMNELNERLANVMMNTRLTEATNKDLMDECERLRKLKGLDFQRVHDMYKDEIEEYKEKLEAEKKESSKHRADAISNEDKYETECLKTEGLRKDIDGLEERIREMGRENGLLKGEMAQMENAMKAADAENARLRDQNLQLQADNERVRCDEKNALEQLFGCQAMVAELENSLALMEATTTEEIERLVEMLKKLKTNTPERQQMWTNEFRALMNDVKAEYDRNLNIRLEEIKNTYEEQLAMIQRNAQKEVVDSEIAKTQTKTLKSQMGENKNRIGELERDLDALQRRYDDLNRKYNMECEDCENEKCNLRDKIAGLEAELDAIMQDLQTVKDSNLTMTMEIATYRRLLTAEEQSMKKLMESQSGDVQSAGASALSGIIRGSGTSQQSSTTWMSESSMRISYRRTTTCGVAFGAAGEDGSFVELKNSSGREFNLSNWTLKKTSPSGEVSFKFPPNTTVRRSDSIRVYSKMAADEARGQGSFLADFYSFGGAPGRFSLNDESNTEKASLDISTAR